MHKLVFAPYTEGDVESVSWRLYNVLWSALYNGNWKIPAEDRGTTKTMSRLLDAYDKVLHKARRNGIDVKELKTGGAELLLEEAEFDLLKESVKALKPHVPMAWSRDIVLTEEFLTGAETIKTEEKEKKDG